MVGWKNAPLIPLRATLSEPTAQNASISPPRTMGRTPASSPVIAAIPDLESASLFELTRRRSGELWRGTGYYRLLNRMLFRAAEPELRYRIFERFYGLSGGLIRRFYAGRLKWFDKVRVLIGKPPVPVHRALRCFAENRGPRTTLSSSNGGTQ